MFSAGGAKSKLVHHRGSAAPSRFTKVEAFDVGSSAPSGDTEIIRHEEVKQETMAPRKMIVLENFCKSYVDLRVVKNYHAYNVGQQNLSLEQK